MPVCLFSVHKAIRFLLHDCTKCICIGAGAGEGNLLVINSSWQSHFSNGILARHQRNSSWEGAHVVCFVGKPQQQSSHSSPLYCGFPQEYCLCTLSIFGKVVTLIWIVRILLCWHPFPENHHHLVIGDGQSLKMSFKSLSEGCSDRRCSWQFCWALGSLTTNHQEMPALPVFLTGLMEMFVPVSSAHFICSFVFLTEQIDPTGGSNQAAVLEKGKCPRLLWTVCERHR